MKTPKIYHIWELILNQFYVFSTAKVVEPITKVDTWMAKTSQLMTIKNGLSSTKAILSDDNQEIQRIRKKSTNQVIQHRFQCRFNR